MWSLEIELMTCPLGVSERVKKYHLNDPISIVKGWSCYTFHSNDFHSYTEECGRQETQAHMNFTELKSSSLENSALWICIVWPIEDWNITEWPLRLIQLMQTENFQDCSVAVKLQSYIAYCYIFYLLYIFFKRHCRVWRHFTTSVSTNFV